MYGNRNLLPLAITLIVLLRHNAVIVEKSLIPAFSRLTLQPTTRARKNIILWLWWSSFHSDGEGLTAQNPKHLTAQQNSQLCGRYCADLFCTRAVCPGEFRHQRRAPNAFEPRGLLSNPCKGLSTPTLQPVILMAQSLPYRAIQCLTLWIPSHGGTSAHPQATQNKCSRPWTLQLGHWMSS